MFTSVLSSKVGFFNWFWSSWVWELAYPEAPPHAQYPNSSIRESQKGHRSCSAWSFISSFRPSPPYTTWSAFFPQIFLWIFMSSGISSLSNPYAVYKTPNRVFYLMDVVCNACLYIRNIISLSKCHVPMKISIGN